jgi:transcription elongation GreA/GreB family factor
MSKQEGDAATIQTPGGKRRFEIIKLLTIHDSEE